MSEIPTISISELRAQFSAVLRRVERGEVLMITRRGRPLARLAPDIARSSRKRRSAEEIAESFRALRERLAAEGFDPDFDWKAAVEDGRE